MPYALNLLISPLLARHGTDQLAALVDEPNASAAGFDGDDLACVGHANLDALPGDLDAAAAGYLPLDGQAGLWQRVWPGEADALQPVPLRIA